MTAPIPTRTHTLQVPNMELDIDVVEVRDESHPGRES